MARRKKILQGVRIVDIADRGLGLGRTGEGEVVLVQGTVPGDVIDMLVLRKKKGLKHGVVHSVHQFSEERAEPFCAHFGVCGGCKWQNLQYAGQLKYKEQAVRNTLVRIGKVEQAEFLPIAGAREQTCYRNKLEFSFSNKRWITREEIDQGVEFTHRDGVGFHTPGAFDKVVDVKKCWLQPDPSNQIRNLVRTYAHAHGIPFYDIRNRAGGLRSMIVRNNREGDVMVILSYFADEHGGIDGLVSHLCAEVPQIRSVYTCENQKVNDTILDLPLKHRYGEAYLVETLFDVRFMIGPKSFFQTNPGQAEALFGIVKQFCDFRGNETVYDLYCGVGSIALTVAAHCGIVVGIEEVQAAIDDAAKNAEINAIENAHFYAGDVRMLLDEQMIGRHGRPDILITDPPRAGMHADVVRSILEFGPEKIVYVSCNVSTQARDIQLLSEQYRVVKSQPVDMFPHTHHIENVVILIKHTG